MTRDELLEIFPRYSRVICDTIEQRLEVTEICLEAGFLGCNSGYSERILRGTADGEYMHPISTVEPGDTDGVRPMVSYSCAPAFANEDDISFDEFMRLLGRYTAVEFECGELSSLLEVPA